MTVLHAIAHWIGEHANKLASLIRAALYMGVALHWTQLTDVQIGSILMFTEVFLALFVETNTVSKVRVGERITQEVDRQMSGTGGGV